MAAHSGTASAAVYNVPGALADVAEVVACIRSAVPGAQITWDGGAAAVPGGARSGRLRPRRGPFPRTQLAYGVAATVAHFRTRRLAGRPAEPGRRLSRWRRVSASSTKNCAASKPAASQSTASNEPVASRTAPSTNGAVAPIVYPSPSIIATSAPDSLRRPLEVERQGHDEREQAALGDAGQQRADVGEPGHGHEHDRAGDEAEAEPEQERVARARPDPRGTGQRTRPGSRSGSSSRAGGRRSGRSSRARCRRPGARR